MRSNFLEIVQVRNVSVHIDDETRRRRDALLADHKCIACEKRLAEGERTTCGQCLACYVASCNYIKRGEISRQELIRTGKQLPPSKGGRKPSNPFTKQLAERRS